MKPTRLVQPSQFMFTFKIEYALSNRKEWHITTSNIAMCPSYRNVLRFYPLVRTIDLKNAKRPSKRAKFKKNSYWRSGKKKIIGHLEVAESVIS